MLQPRSQLLGQKKKKKGNSNPWSAFENFLVCEISKSEKNLLRFMQCS